VSKTVGGSTRHYLYDRDMLLAGMDPATGGVLRATDWGVLGLVNDRANSLSRFFAFDAHGNTRNIFTASGTPILNVRGAFTAYGSVYGNLAPDSAFG
jgi:hypothetical protein